MAQPESKKELHIGGLDDGGIYVGKSATTGQDLHAAVADFPQQLDWDGAFTEAASMRKHGHPTAHVPTVEELRHNLFDNRDAGALKGTFNTSGSCFEGEYKSDEPYISGFTKTVSFRDGSENLSRWINTNSVRFVW